MSMNTCFKCGVVYDTDDQMEMIDDEMVCDRCYEDNCCCECGDVLKKNRREEGICILCEVKTNDVLGWHD